MDDEIFLVGVDQDESADEIKEAEAAAAGPKPTEEQK